MIGRGCHDCHGSKRVGTKRCMEDNQDGTFRSERWTAQQKTLSAKLINNDTNPVHLRHREEALFNKMMHCSA